jgi:hypothetical protein
MCWERYALTVMSFFAKTSFSYVGISARDALAVEVVYHHCFFVFGQRSVHNKKLVKDAFSL